MVESPLPGGDQPNLPDPEPREPEIYVPNDDPVAVPTDPPVYIPTDVPVDPPGDVPAPDDGDDLPLGRPPTNPS